MLDRKILKQQLVLIYRLAKDKNISELNRLVEQGICLSEFKGPFNPIILLARDNHREAVDFLIDHFAANPNDALVGYAMGRHVETVNELISQGVNPKFALLGYAMGGYDDQVNQLISEGVNPANALSGYAMSGNMVKVNEFVHMTVHHQQEIALSMSLVGYGIGGHNDKAGQLIASKKRAASASFWKGLAIGGHIEPKSLLNHIIMESHKISASIKTAIMDIIEAYAMGGHVNAVNWLLNKYSDIEISLSLTNDLNPIESLITAVTPFFSATKEGDAAASGYAMRGHIGQVNDLLEKRVANEDSAAVAL